MGKNIRLLRKRARSPNVTLKAKSAENVGMKLQGWWLTTSCLQPAACAKALWMCILYVCVKTNVLRLPRFKARWEVGKGKVIIYFEFSHCGSGATDKVKLCDHLLVFFVIQQTGWVVLCRWFWEAGCRNLENRKSHAASLGCLKEPRYLLDTAVPPQQVGELM